MTVRMDAGTRSRLTDRPVKGMLTGPVTMLAWSFVRDDQPLGDTAGQVALALRDEVIDLEAAGDRGHPGRRAGPARDAAAARGGPGRSTWPGRREAFRLATAGVADDTQIHTHMCYAEFGDIVPAIDDLDADVISLEAARSDMAVARELAGAGYPREVGPVCRTSIRRGCRRRRRSTGKLRDAVAAFPAERLWVNPDCGLKTRRYPETLASLENLVAAAHRVRAH